MCPLLSPLDIYHRPHPGVLPSCALIPNPTALLC